MEQFFASDNNIQLLTSNGSENRLVKIDTKAKSIWKIENDLKMGRPMSRQQKTPLRNVTHQPSNHYIPESFPSRKQKGVYGTYTLFKLASNESR